MNIEDIENLNLRCTFCKNDTFIKENTEWYYLECTNKDCKHNKENTLFLRIYIKFNIIDFYINSIEEHPFGFSTENYNDTMITYSKEKIISLLEEYSKTGDLNVIRNKYFTLMLFK